MRNPNKFDKIDPIIRAGKKHLKATSRFSSDVSHAMSAAFDWKGQLERVGRKLFPEMNY